ncbi:MAG: hypothetical protein PUF37_05335 [Prevotellaceae bacterium]|nr:hypothetical protein [Prevotellaceae bacterium]
MRKLILDDKMVALLKDFCDYDHLSNMIDNLEEVRKDLEEDQWSTMDDNERERYRFRITVLKDTENELRILRRAQL